MFQNHNAPMRTASSRMYWGGVSPRTLEYANRSRRRTAIGRIQQGIDQRATDLSMRQVQYNSKARVRNWQPGGVESVLRPFRAAGNMTQRVKGFNRLYENGRRLNRRNRG